MLWPSTYFTWASSFLCPKGEHLRPKCYRMISVGSSVSLLCAPYVHRVGLCDAVFLSLQPGYPRTDGCQGNSCMAPSESSGGSLPNHCTDSVGTAGSYASEPRVCVGMAPVWNKAAGEKGQGNILQKEATPGLCATCRCIYPVTLTPTWRKGSRVSISQVGKRRLRKGYSLAKGHTARDLIQVALILGTVLFTSTGLL